MNTKYFAEIISLVKKGTDPLSTGIINEGLLQLDKTSRTIFQTLKDLTLLHKEKYKLEVRRVATTSMKLESDYVFTHQDDAIRKVRLKIAESGIDQPFYPELVAEVLKEDYSSDGESLRDEVMQRFQVAVEKSQELSAERNFKAVLLDGARVIIGVGFQLDDAVKKLEENEAILESMDKSFMTKVKKALREMMGKKREHVLHDVEYLDPVSSERKNESIDFTSFCQEATKRAQNLTSMVSKSGAAFKRMEGSSEDLIYKFLSKSIEELQTFHRKLSALDDFFLGAIEDPEFKGRVRNIKSELGSLKNAIIKANQKRHEYIAQKEELEQMKRLGIKEV